MEKHYGQQTRSGTYTGCTAYNDFRELIADKNVDAVVIAVPDHWHTIPAIEAARAGKDVYLEKPMTLTHEEGRALADVVKRYDRVFQHGTQQRSGRRFRRAAQLARSGRLGKLHTVEVGVYGGRATGYHAPQPVPEGFDFPLWLGQAPWAPFTAARCVGVRPWMCISDYSGGLVTGWGIHHIDSAHWGMGTDDTGPIEIEGEGVFPADGLYDTVLTWRLECRYANGMRMIFTDHQKNPQGIKFIGTDGWVFVNRQTLEAEPASLLESPVDPSEAQLYHSNSHHGNFLECIRTRKETICPAELAHRSTSVCHLVNICLQVGRKVRWNPAKERFVNDPEADRLLSRAMRSPWHL